ncbi:MAG: RluA family pseudouridine synthase [Candidatus Pacebacteria bacterium]|nr:RluA family pseudouridine synthase [Candidatus Paceibacterota bacterium]
MPAITNSKIKVLYEDANILAIDKPSGILVHPDERSKEKTILDLFIKKYLKLEIVHRLDRETSGVLLLAKNKKAHEFLKKQFQNREIKKVYHAIVSGNVKNERGIINKPIGRSPKDFRRYSAGRGARGEMREAITQYRVLKRFVAKAKLQEILHPRGSHSAGEGRRGGKLLEAKPQRFTYLEIRPKTGRTHQIRVHMKYLNHPIVCDSLYNPDNPCPKGIFRVALHAKSIEFKNLKGETIKVESAIPKEFEKVVK